MTSVHGESQETLQFGAEKSKLPPLGQPCLLAGSILELRKAMEPYISFCNDTVLSGVAPQEGFLEDQPETTTSGSTQPASADALIEEAAMEEATPIEDATTEEAAPLGGLRRNPVLPRPQVRCQPGR